MKPAQLNDIFFRLQRQHQHQEQLLGTILAGCPLSTQAFQLLPLLLGAFEKRAIARAQEHIEVQLSMGGTSWEELSRPTAATLNADINHRPLRI